MYNLTDLVKQFNFLSLEKGSTAEFLVNTSHYVFHMAPDSYQPGNIIYSDKHSLKTTDGVTTAIIAGYPSEPGYVDAYGENAGFEFITGFIGITAKILIAADHNNHCLRRIQRDTRLTTTFSGVSGSSGYQDGTPAKFYYPRSITRDNQNSSQLLVTDEYNSAIRTVAVSDGSVGTLIKSDALWRSWSLTQNTAGDIFVTTNSVVYRISYTEKTITLIAGSPVTLRYRDSSLLNSLFYFPRELTFIQTNKLLIADEDNHKLRILDLDKDKVTTLNLCNGCVSLYRPYSIMLTNNSLYVGLYQEILRFKCKF